ncbi:LuxR C-terminal-related transcriptional regulator [Nonomuraea sp. NBC_01738]|uniref:helix-turn-helix transcriptional regulator n=1 Tax=Nonomuraea sp. NBC_01738 TaxID=2976003 RepID=UPI002E0F05E1|nr:LuxR C-terminal-related transcriptional regulator [Nonomuraea sp. NBC_01738]
MLVSLGVYPLAEQVYRLLLARTGLEVAAIAQELSITEAQVREVLDHLAELALLQPSWESPGGFRPVSPQVGLQVLLQRRQVEMRRQQKQIAEAESAIASLVSEYSDLHPAAYHPGAEPILGMDAIQTRIERLAADTVFEVVSMMPGGAQEPELIDAAKLLDRQVLHRGVAIRTMGLNSIRNDPPTMAYAEWLSENGAHVRTVPTLPIRMLVYDRSIAFLPLDTGNTRVGAVQVSDSGTVTAVLALFDQIWNVATPIGTPLIKDQEGLLPQERQLLKLLAEGLTDEAAGHHLGLSQRTVRRMMAGIMERLGARSRFEAGLRAAEKGWL